MDGVAPSAHDAHRHDRKKLPTSPSVSEGLFRLSSHSRLVYSLSTPIGSRRPALGPGHTPHTTQHVPTAPPATTRIASLDGRGKPWPSGLHLKAQSIGIFTAHRFRLQWAKLRHSSSRRVRRHDLLSRSYAGRLGRQRDATSARPVWLQNGDRTTSPGGARGGEKRRGVRGVSAANGEQVANTVHLQAQRHRGIGHAAVATSAGCPPHQFGLRAHRCGRRCTREGCPSCLSILLRFQRVLRSIWQLALVSGQPGSWA